MHNENRFLDTFRGHNTRPNVFGHGETFWTRTRSKYTDLGEFETIWLYKTIRL